MDVFKPLKLKASYEVRFSPDGRLLAVVGSKCVQIWNLASRVRMDVQQVLSDPSHVAFSPDSSLIAVKNTSGRIAFHNVDSGKVVLKIRDANVTEGCGCVYSPCGKFILDGSWDGELRVLDCKSGRVVFSRMFPNEMIEQILSFKGGRKIVTRHQPKAKSDDDTPDLPYFMEWIWPLTRTSKPKRIPKRVDIQSGAAISVNGTHLAVLTRGYPKADVEVYAFPKMKRLCQIKIQSRNGAFAWSPDGSMLAVMESGRMAVYDWRLKKVLLESPCEYGCAVDFSPDGRLLAFGDWNMGLVMGTKE